MRSSTLARAGRLDPRAPRRATSTCWLHGRLRRHRLPPGAPLALFRRHEATRLGAVHERGGPRAQMRVRALLRGVPDRGPSRNGKRRLAGRWRATRSLAAAPGCTRTEKGSMPTRWTSCSQFAGSPSGRARLTSTAGRGSGTLEARGDPHAPHPKRGGESLPTLPVGREVGAGVLRAAARTGGPCAMSTLTISVRTRISAASGSGRSTWARSSISRPTAAPAAR
jgi:hypothetical protein